MEVAPPLGMPNNTKTDEFSEKFQTAFDPPPPTHFQKVILQFFPKFMTEVSSIMAKVCNIIFWIENAPPPPLWNFSENSSVLVAVRFPQ